MINAQKMKFSIKYFFSKCDQIRSFQSIFTEEIYTGKVYLCSGYFKSFSFTLNQDRVNKTDLAFFCISKESICETNLNFL